jgi:hypothetical protein
VGVRTFASMVTTNADGKKAAPKKAAPKKAAKAAPKKAAPKKAAPKEAAKAAPKKAAKAAPKKKSVTTSLATLAERYRSAFDAAQAALTKRHGIGKKGGSWAYDQTTQELRFTADGTMVVARASLLGSWSNESWMWAWSNTSILEPVARASREVKKAARSLGIAELTDAVYFASAETVDRVAVASFGLLDAKGCYFPSTATGKLVFVLHAIGDRVAAE